MISISLNQQKSWNENRWTKEKQAQTHNKRKPNKQTKPNSWSTWVRHNFGVSIQSNVYYPKSNSLFFLILMLLLYEQRHNKKKSNKIVKCVCFVSKHTTTILFSFFSLILWCYWFGLVFVGAFFYSFDFHWLIFLSAYTSIAVFWWFLIECTKACVCVCTCYFLFEFFSVYLHFGVYLPVN